MGKNFRKNAGGPLSHFLGFHSILALFTFSLRLLVRGTPLPLANTAQLCACEHIHPAMPQPYPPSCRPSPHPTGCAQVELDGLYTHVRPIFARTLQQLQRDRSSDLLALRPSSTIEDELCRPCPGNRAHHPLWLFAMMQSVALKVIKTLLMSCE
jgi:hypothetical protein